MTVEVELLAIVFCIEVPLFFSVSTGKCLFKCSAVFHILYNSRIIIIIIIIITTTITIITTTITIITTIIIIIIIAFDVQAIADLTEFQTWTILKE